MKNPPDSETKDQYAKVGESSDQPETTENSAMAELARRVKASKEPPARALMPMTGEVRRKVIERVMGSPKVKPLASHRRWIPLALVAVLGISLWFIIPPSRIHYEDALEGMKTERVSGQPASENDAILLKPGTQLKITLKGTPPTAGMDFKILVLDENGKAHHVPKLIYQTDGQGTFTIDTRAQGLLGNPQNGSAQLVFILAKAWWMPDENKLIEMAEAGANESYWGITIIRRNVIFEGFEEGAGQQSPTNVKYAGCEAIISDSEGRVCEIHPEKKELTVWAPLSIPDNKKDREISILIDGRQSSEIQYTTVEEGTRFSLSLSGEEKELKLESSQLNAPFVLRLRQAAQWPEVEKARKLKAEDKPDEAASVLSAMNASDPQAKLAKLRLQARIARLKGNMIEAKQGLKETIELAQRLGRDSEALIDMLILGNILLNHDQDFAEAARYFKEAETKEGACDACKAEGDLYRAYLSMERGQYEEALSRLRSAAILARKLNLTQIESEALQASAELYQVRGYDEQAIRMLEDAQRLANSNTCEWASAQTAVAWAQYRAAQTDGEKNHAYLSAVYAVYRLYGESCGWIGGTAWTNKAFAELLVNRPQDARFSAEQAKKLSSGDKRMGAWLTRLELEIAVAEDPTSAFALAEALEQKMLQATNPELLFDALFAKAQALDKLGRIGEAKQAYDHAMEALGLWGSGMPLGEGLLAFFERQHRATRLWIDFLARRAGAKDLDPETTRLAALDVARAIRQSLSLFYGALPSSPHRAKLLNIDPLLPNELSLLIYPTHEDWVILTVEPSGAATLRRTSVDLAGLAQSDLESHSSAREALAKTLLSPLQPMFERCKKLRIFAPRMLNDLSVEALPWREKLLADEVSVRYGLDVPGAETEESPLQPDCAGKPFMLMATDPSRNLEGAEETGKVIRSQMQPYLKSLQHDEATKPNIVKALEDPCITIFQFDGHAKFGGTDGRSAAMELAGGEALTVPEILALKRVPPTVVLSACETAKEEGLGLAQAFLLRGAREVLATKESVGDQLAGRIMTTMYKHAGPQTGKPWELGEALSLALRNLHEKERGWNQFRVLVR